MALPDSDARDLRGTTLAGRYRLQDVIGAGGMGTVWRATQLALSRDVAVKMLDVPEDVVNRLRTEALALAALRHPNIVGVIDFAEDANHGPFIAMELVDGENLEQMLTARGPLAPAMAVALTIPIVEALAYAHRRGVIHRDLKPANVLLERSDGSFAPKLVDFGIAVRAADGGGSRAAAGTPAYMAPEQIRGEPVDARTDVWGVAALLYEAVEGVPPFGEGESFAVMASILNEPPRPTRQASPSLEQLLVRALAKDPLRRTPSAQALLAELRASEPGTKASTAALARTLPSPASAARPPSDSLDALVRARFGGS